MGDKEYDLGKLAQPFINKFIEGQKGYTSKAAKNFDLFSKVTGLNQEDINTAVTSPKKVAYIEETLRNIESGNLKIRVRSLENEKALERMSLTQSRMENLRSSSVLLNAAGIAAGPIFTTVGVCGAAFFGFQAFVTNTKFAQTTFEGDE